MHLSAEGGEGLLVGSVDGALGVGTATGGGSAGCTAGSTTATAGTASRAVTTTSGTVTTGRAVRALGALRAGTSGGSELAVDLDGDLLLLGSLGLGGGSLLLIEVSDVR